MTEPSAKKVQAFVEANIHNVTLKAVRGLENPRKIDHFTVFYHHTRIGRIFLEGRRYRICHGFKLGPKLTFRRKEDAERALVRDFALAILSDASPGTKFKITCDHIVMMHTPQYIASEFHTPSLVIRTGYFTHNPYERDLKVRDKFGVSVLERTAAGDVVSYDHELVSKHLDELVSCAAYPKRLSQL